MRDGMKWRGSSAIPRSQLKNRFMNKEDLTNRIRALLAKADITRGATEAEASASMNKAQELMTKYGIDHVDEEDTSTFGMDHEDVVMNRVSNDFDVNIAHILSDCFGVRVLFSITRLGQVTLHGFILVGERINIELAKIALGILDKTMMKRPRGSTMDQRSYYFGVERGYITASDQGRQKALEQAEKMAVDRYAVVLVKKEEALSRYMTSTFGQPPEVTEDRGPISPGAFLQGFAAGAVLDLTATPKLDAPPEPPPAPFRPFEPSSACSACGSSLLPEEESRGICCFCERWPKIPE